MDAESLDFDAWWAEHYENQTPEALKAAALAALVGTVETREGSYADLLVSPWALQEYKTYQLMPMVRAMAFPDETCGEYIDRRAADFGLTRTPGTRAWVVLRFTSTSPDRGVTVPAGTVVATDDGLRFATLEEAVVQGTADVPAQAAEVGRIYNVDAASLTTMQVNLVGIQSVTNPEPATGGADEESSAAFLARYRAYLQRPISSGNKNHYISWATEVSGVGSAAVVPLWDGPGTVKVIIGGPDKEPVDEDIVAACAAHIEEERPIGAAVTVVSASTSAASITLTQGAEAAEVEADLTAALKELLAGLPFGEAGLVRYSRVLGLLLACDGVEEYQSCTLNGGTANVSLTGEETPQVGTVTVTEG